MKQESIVYVIFSFGNGGTQRMLVNILNLVKVPHFKRTIFLYNDTAEYNLNVKLDPDIKIISYTGIHKLKFLVRLKYLYNIIKQEKASKVFCLSIQGAYLALSLRLLTNLRFKIIYRMVSVDTALVSSKKALIRKIKEFFYYDILCKKVDKIIAQTYQMAKELIKKRDHLDTNKVIVIKNLVEYQAIIEKSNTSIEIEKPYIIFVGKLSVEKNIPGIIEAFNLIKYQIDEDLIIVGSGYQKDSLEHSIRNLKLENRVIMLGHQNNPYKYVKKAKLMVLFSDYEGLPNVVLEAMVCQTPVICSDFEGAKEIITDGENGYIVERRNVKQLAEKIGTALKKGNSNQMINKALEFVYELNKKSIEMYQETLK